MFSIVEHILEDRLPTVLPLVAQEQSPLQPGISVRLLVQAP
jgi:hypothetical protein